MGGGGEEHIFMGLPPRTPPNSQNEKLRKISSCQSQEGEEYKSLKNVPRMLYITKAQSPWGKILAEPYPLSHSVDTGA